MSERVSQATIAKNSNEIRSAIREQVQALLQRKLSIWDSNTNWQKLIDEETDKIMKIIKHESTYVGKENISLISQATIAHNEAKGQLYRKRGEENKGG